MAWRLTYLEVVHVEVDSRPSNSKVKGEHYDLFTTLMDGNELEDGGISDEDLIGPLVRLPFTYIIDLFHR